MTKWQHTLRRWFAALPQRRDVDYRSHRGKLPSESFAISDGEASTPTDPFTPDLWNHVVGLPDDVSLRTSDHHGCKFAGAHRVESVLVAYGLELQEMLGLGAYSQEGPSPQADPLDEGLAIATDELQGSIYLALTGYYAQAVRCLRVALEAMLTGAYCRATGDSLEFGQWLEGFDQPWASKMRGALAKREPYRTVNGQDGVFVGPKDAWLNRLYSQRLSPYSHARPYTHDDGSRLPTANVTLWQSNGPIYVPAAVGLWYARYVETSLAVSCLLGLAEPPIVRVVAPRWGGPAFVDFVRDLNQAHTYGCKGSEAVVRYLTGA